MPPIRADGPEACPDHWPSRPIAAPPSAAIAIRMTPSGSRLMVGSGRLELGVPRAQETKSVRDHEERAPFVADDREPEREESGEGRYDQDSDHAEREPEALTH